MILLQQAIKIISMPPDPNDWWKYLSPILSALFGYLGGLLTPATLNRLKFWRIFKKLRLTPDYRHEDYYGIRVDNRSHYKIHDASMSVWLNFGPREIVERGLARNIYGSNRRQLAGDSLPWATNPLAPLGRKSDLNPGESQYILFARKFENGFITIASEYGLSDENGQSASVELKVNICDGVIKLVSADSFPAFYHIRVDINNAFDSNKLILKRILERDANNQIKSFDKNWNARLKALYDEKALTAAIARKKK